MISLASYIAQAARLIGKNSELLNKIKIDDDLYNQTEKIVRELDTYATLVSGKSPSEVYSEIGFEKEDLLTDYQNPVALKEVIDFTKNVIFERYSSRTSKSAKWSLYASNFAKKTAPIAGVAIPIVLGSLLIVTPISAEISVEVTAEVYGTYDQDIKFTPGMDIDSTSNITCFGDADIRTNGEQYQSSGVENLTIRTDTSTGEVGEVRYNPAVYSGMEIDMMLRDGDAKEVIHPIEGEPVYSTPQDALNTTYNQVRYLSDEELYGLTEAWANPEMTLMQGAGDCEDSAFLLVSRVSYHTENPPSTVYAHGLSFTPDPSKPNEVVGHMNVLYWNGETWIAQEPTGNFEFDASKFGYLHQKSLLLLNSGEVIYS